MDNVKKIRTICNVCQAGCSGVVAHVKGNTILKVEGDKDCPPSNGRLCVKGFSTPFVANNPNRILKPLKRTNPEKGLGVDPKWKEISWEEAFDEIVPRMKKVREENPLKMMLASFDYPSYYHMIPWCIAAGAQYYVGSAVLCGQYHNACYQYYLSFFREADYDHCNYLLLWGTQSGHLVDAVPVPSAKKLADARTRGARIVVIDPVATPAASLADEWIPIRPGTDGALALCFGNLLLNEYKLYDEDFIRAKTNGPYLVAQDESYVRDEKTNKPMVWDKRKNVALPFDQVEPEHMALEGAYEVNGTKCHPSFYLVKEHLKSFSPKKVSEITTIPVADIRRIAKEFGEAAQIGSTITLDGKSMPHRPAAMLAGRGPNAHRHAMHTTFALEMLNVFIGNPNVPGGVLGIAPVYKNRWETGVDDDGIATSPNYSYWHFWGAMDSYPARPVTKPVTLNLNGLFPISAYSDGMFPLAMSNPERFGIDYNLDFLILAHVNPAATYSNGVEMVEKFKKIDFILGFATEWTESVEMCDVVLPNAHWIERYDPISNPPFKFVEPGMGDWNWFFRRPAIKPPDPSIRHWQEIMLEITERAGFAKEFYQAFNEHNVIREPNQLDPEKDNSFMNMCDAVMKDRYGVDIDWYEKNKTNVCVQKKSIEEAYPGAFTPGRCNIYMEYWKKAGEEVKATVKEMGIENVWDTTDYQPLISWWPGCSFEQKEDYDLFAVNYKTCFHAFSHSMYNPITLEIGHVYPWVYGVQINSETARQKGIATGDDIWIESEFGYRVTGKAYITEGIHPECIGTSGIGGRLTHGEKTGRKVGPSWNTLMGQNLERIDKLSSALDSCFRVKIYKA